MLQKEDLICNQVTILETMFTGFLNEREYKMSAKEFQTALKLFYEAEMKKWFNKIRDSGEKMERGLLIRKKIMELHNLTYSDSSLEEYYQAEKPKLQAIFERTYHLAMPKYRGRKKLSPKEAQEFLDSTYRVLYTFTEIVYHWKTQPRSKSDMLIEAHRGQTREEIIAEAERCIEYCLSKIEYGKQFLPDYKPNIAYFMSTQIPQVGEIWSDGLDCWLISEIQPDGFIKAKDLEEKSTTVQAPDYFLEKIQ